MRFLSCFALLGAVALMGADSSAQAQVYAGFGSPDNPQAIPILPAPTVLPVRPLTVNEFAGAFKPLPGQYQVLLIHPKTGCPVKVCFTLKPGCIRTVRVNAHKIDFVYAGQCNVVIRFLHSGKVWVRD